MNKKKSNLFPIITLLVLAPVFGELLSGSTPPNEYFHPLSFFLLTMLYGIGALLVREAARRWDKGWISILLMGMAYGIYEEGVVVHSFFDPNWADLGLLAQYGRWIGVNWIWSIALTIFHAVVSISLPIAITELLFSKQKNEVWLSKRVYIVLMAIFLINALLGPLFKMKITVLGMFASIVSIIGLVLVANNWAEDDKKDSLRKNASQWKIILAGAILTFGLMGGLWIFPSIGFPWVLDFIFLCILPWFGVWLLNRLGKQTWEDQEKWAAVTGLLIPWLLVDVILELNNANQQDDMAGLTAIAVGILILLVTLRIIIFQRIFRQNAD
ncbi:MAG: hypothetical protein J7L66_00470 [Anaerolineaceae bacterium]|nr:hypothetical protein [Anaerolineaceae bacterium]